MADDAMTDDGGGRGGKKFKFPFYTLLVRAPGSFCYTRAQARRASLGTEFIIHIGRYVRAYMRALPYASSK
jgi:hypothetical protein